MSILNENCIHYEECIERFSMTIATTMFCQLSGRTCHGFDPDCDNCNMFVEKGKNEVGHEN